MNTQLFIKTTSLRLRYGVPHVRRLIVMEELDMLLTQGTDL